MVTEKILTHPNIEIEIKEITEVTIDDLITIVATGPLTSNILAENLKKLTGSEYLYFYDAAAPIVFKESLNLNKVFWASRYDKEGAHYLNCPMDKQEYLEFYNELLSGERYGLKDFEKETYFEGCMPIEVLANEVETLVYGPLKPVGLTDKRTGKKPYAAVQLYRITKKERF